MRGKPDGEIVASFGDAGVVRGRFGLPARLTEQGGTRDNATGPAAAERLMTAREAADYCRVHPNTIYLAAQSGELRSRRIGRLRRFTVADLDEWTRSAS